VRPQLDRRVAAGAGDHRGVVDVVVAVVGAFGVGTVDQQGGTPVSSLVGSLVFVTPALLARQGASTPRPRYAVGTVSVPLRRNAHRDVFVRAVHLRDGEGVLEPILGQESHMIARAAAAEALLHVPRGDGEIAAGSPVRFLPLT
jgi:molybdopterin molybdotransferase